MVRKLAAVFLLSLFIFVLAASASGADKAIKPMKERSALPTRFAPVYSFPDETGGQMAPATKAPEKVGLRAPMGPQNPTQVGTTTYDYQHNCTMGRQVEHRAGYSNPPTQYGIYVDIGWMHMYGDTLGGTRKYGYQAYEITGCSFVFGAGGIDIDPSRAGYVTIDSWNVNPANSWAVPASHMVNDGYVPAAYWDFQLGGSHFGVFNPDWPLDKYGYYITPHGNQNENIWPKIDFDVDGADLVLHMVTSETSPPGTPAGSPQTQSYYRRVGPYGTDAGVWSSQRLIDTVMNINADVASSPISDKVAVIWNAPVDYIRDQGAGVEFASQYENDVWFAISNDNGATWANNPSPANPSIGNTVDLGVGANPGHLPTVGGNITKYQPTDDFKAYCDISAVWSIAQAPNDYLQIIWGCRRWTDTTSLFRRQGALFHWNQQTNSIRTVIKALWDTGGACYGHAWGTDAAKISISECDGRLYTLYTQFGSMANPCGDNDNVNNVVNGYLYMTVYDPVYDAWDRPQRVTTTPTTATGCTPGTYAGGAGTCNSEYWGSMARYGRVDTCKITPRGPALDVLYVNDYAPGGCVQTESGVWTVNPVNWVVYPCRAAVPEPGYVDDAGAGYGLCVGQPILVLKTTDDTTFTFTMENPGLLNNAYTIQTFIDSGGNGGTTFGAAPPAGTITAKGGTVVVTVTITTAGETDNTTVYGRIRVNHAAEGSPRIIPVCLTVSNAYVPVEFATIETACKRLRVYNNGEMGNNTINEAMDFVDDPDDCANIYLYDGSPIICRKVGLTTECFFAVFDNAYATDHALRQVSPMVYDAVSNPSYRYATAEFITADSAIGLIVEYFAPKHADSCSFIIQKLKFWNRTGTALADVAVGEALDFDIPSWPVGKNESGYDATRQLIYQYGCDNDNCDTLAANARYGGIAAWKDKPFKNYMTLDNATYVYTSGPFGNDAPLPRDTIYKLMKNRTGFFPVAVDSCQDMTTLVTFGVYTMQPNDTECVTKILTTSKDDATGSVMKANVDKGNAFITAHPEMKCPLDFVCDCRPGDANNDGSKNVGDAVYLIAYVFKGGAAPTPYPKCSGDANADCSANVGDAVYMIAYVFKGGAPPATCDSWLTNCGMPLRK